MKNIQVRFIYATTLFVKKKQRPSKYTLNLQHQKLKITNERILDKIMSGV